MKRYTDAEYEVVNEPRPRVELPGWFKTGMWAAVIVLLLATQIWRWYDHRSTAPQAGRPATAAPQAPGAR